MNKLPSRKFTGLLAFIGATGLTVSALGQTPATSSTSTSTTNKDEPQVLEKYVVTGSYLPPAANSVAVPVITVDTNSIANQGSNNILEILRKTAPQFSGNGNLGVTNANVGSGSTQGGSQLALRNATTLVLVNGRRMAYSAADATGGYQFVDVNLLPVAAIERVEILPDGASAIYGSDAISGVVNIILKTDYNGFEAGGRYGWTTNKGHAAERSAYVAGGLSNGKTSLGLSAEWVKDDPIFAYERPYSDPTYGTPTFAGSVNIGAQFYYLDPTKNAPTVTAGGLPAATLVSQGVYSGPKTQGDMFSLFNLSQYVTQRIQNEREGFTLSFEHKVSDNLRGFGDVLFSHTNTYSQINGQPINSSALAALPAGSAPGAGGTKIPAGLYGNPFNVDVTARNRLVGNPREYRYDTQGIRGVGGFGGKINEDWDWEVAGTWNRIAQDYQNPGVINNAALANAIITNQFNFFARQQAAGVIQNTGIVGTATGGFISKLISVDAKVRGHLFQLPAGPVDLALGGEQRKESLSATADPLSQLDPVTGELGWNGATTLYPFDANRTTGAVFAEVRVPIANNQPGLHLLEASAAVRHEFISDTENPTVPKFTVRYLPVNDEFALRATYSKSFTAPTLYQLFGPVSIGFTDPFTLNKLGGGTVANMQTNSQSGANPNLKPSRSKNWTAGFVYSPKAVRGLSLSIDYWKIDQVDLISSIPTNVILQDVETKGTASSYANSVRFFGFNGQPVTGTGQISTRAVPDDIYVTANNVNIASQKLDGWDISAKYAYTPSGDVGRFDFSTNIGIYNHYTHVDIPGDPEQETVAKSTDFNGTIPRWQAYTSLTFTRGEYGAFLGWRSIPSVTDDDDGTHVGSFNTLDASVSFGFGKETNGWRRYFSGAKLTVGCTNVFNRFGPLDPTIFSDANVDIATYGAMGRFLYVDLRYKF